MGFKRADGISDGVHYRRRFETAVDHAVCTPMVIADSVIFPGGGFHQFPIGGGMAVTDQVAGALPAENVAGRGSPWGAGKRLVACKKL